MTIPDRRAPVEIVRALYQLSTRAPTPADDRSRGFTVGMRWIDTVAMLEYVAVSVNVGAAVWSTSTGGGDITAERLARIAADNAEAATRAAADLVLQANIATEAATRAAADSALDARVTVLEAEEGDVVYPAVLGAIGGHRVVLYDTVSGGWIYADRTDPTSQDAPLAVTPGAIAMGDSGPGRYAGIMDEPSWTWPAPCALYLDTAGMLTATAPTGSMARLVARALTPTRIHIDPSIPILLV